MKTEYTPAQVAAMVKQALKTKWPSMSWRVTSQRYAGGSICPRGMDGWPDSQAGRAGHRQVPLRRLRRDAGSQDLRQQLTSMATTGSAPLATKARP